MVDQTKINGAKQETSSVSGVRRNLFDLIHDSISLVELQSKLLSFDLTEVKQRIPLAMILIAGGSLLVLATFPIMLLAIGWALVLHAGFSQAVAFGAVGTVGLVVASVIAWIGYRKFVHALRPLERSRHEFQENLKWVKSSMLKGTSDPNQESPNPNPRRR